MHILRPLLKGLVVILLILILVAGAATFTLSRLAFPRTNGEAILENAGLDGPVDIYRDANGIPHIYAETTHDLFLAQGYVHAQDRFWQMDFQRAIGHGRLAQIVGDSQIETDAFLRTLGWSRTAEEELAQMPPEAQDILIAYADGVNAYLEERTSIRLSLEYSVLKLTNGSYQPVPWEPADSLVWAKVMAWNLASNLDLEIGRAIISNEVGKDRVDDLFPPYPNARPVIVPNSRGATATAGHTTAPVEAADLLTTVANRVGLVDDLLGISGADIGSNNWVVSGELTDTGMPILANDPHLPIQMPSIWYEVGLHCAPTGQDCDLQVAGFSLLGVPAVVIGHNERIAWGVTNLGADVQDLYIEKLNPDNPNQYEVNGQWVDMDIYTETLIIAGGKKTDMEVRVTRHGPVISDSFGDLEDFDDKTAVNLPDDYAIALRWTALEPTRLVEAIYGINTADNWGEFRTALSNWDVPLQNFIYADVAGNIGYQMPGRVPIRADGDGRLPVPGWTNQYEWTGFIPFEELPNRFNPPEGFIVTANNAVVDGFYPYWLAREWAYGTRAQRITDLIEEAQGPISVAMIEDMQRDNRNLMAEEIIPYLTGVESSIPEVVAAQELLAAWGSMPEPFQQDADSPHGALYAAVWRHLLATTFHDDLPEDYWPVGRDRFFEVLRSLLRQPSNEWWDSQSTSNVETRDAILEIALRQGWEEMVDEMGNDPAEWRWGELHTASFRNEVFGESGIAPIEWLFNRGGFETAGGGDLVNATTWNASEGYEVVALPSMRLIVDLDDLSRSRAVHTTGQSGHAFHKHYIDMADLWVANETQPLLWERPSIEADAEGHLRLLPGG
jgi:penicillin amidase